MKVCGFNCHLSLFVPGGDFVPQDLKVDAVASDQREGSRVKEFAFVRRGT